LSSVTKLKQGGLFFGQEYSNTTNTTNIKYYKYLIIGLFVYWIIGYSRPEGEHGYPLRNNYFKILIVHCSEFTVHGFSMNYERITVNRGFRVNRSRVFQSFERCGTTRSHSELGSETH